MAQRNSTVAFDSNRKQFGLLNPNNEVTGHFAQGIVLKNVKFGTKEIPGICNTVVQKPTYRGEIIPRTTIAASGLVPVVYVESDHGHPGHFHNKNTGLKVTRASKLILLPGGSTYAILSKADIRASIAADKGEGPADVTSKETTALRTSRRSAYANA